MLTATFRFYEELNNFLPEERRKVDFIYSFDRRASIKDCIESMGVPHTEVDLILVNGVSVGFTYILAHQDRVSVYPVFELLDITAVIRLRPRPLRDPSFVVDVNLGRLARYLRLLGFDTMYRNDYVDQDLVAISSGHGRILLTRDRNLLKYAAITHGCYIHNTEPLRQIKEVILRLDLFSSATPFRRCVRCNGLLQPVEKSEIEERLPPLTRKYYEMFWMCGDCSQIFWKGAHYGRMMELVEGLLR
ncbi:MAG: Mut7-C ubiquitin/RNAse domain-containing protein [Gammaproteobacteria bacterium]|nr:Mut7-C ubiquitin/RNAse domain-containing protein [Gammaproteobacteria bacterium]